MRIGKWVRTHRVARQWSQAELARRVKAEVGGIGRWERDECLPHLEQFRRLCLAFERSADEPLRLPAKSPSGEAAA